MKMASQKTYPLALVVGASRGLGFGLTRELLERGWRVIATERKADPRSPLRALSQAGQDHLRIESVDINEPKQVAALHDRLSREKLDLLFVNAGVASDRLQPVGQAPTEEFNRLMLTNALSPLRTIETLDDLVDSRGTIAVMSSGLASVTENTTGEHEVYRASKAALNTLLRSYAVRAGGERTLLAVVPGWVRTDMGGPEAPLDLETSVRGIVDMLDKQAGKPGVRFMDYNNQPMAW